MLYKIPCSLNADITFVIDCIKKGPETKRRCKATMNKYELALVVNAKIEDEERIATLEAAKEIITRFGGTVTNVDDWDKKKLAYEIQKMNEGYYYFIQFDADSNVPGEVEQRVRILEKVIRYLCIKKDA
jgi:small subunit ribosomal protein S6